MTPNDNTNYNPADDDNQGVIQPLIQATNGGFSQTGGITVPTASGPEPEKAEVADSEADNGLNDDILEEEDIEKGNVDVDYEDGDN
jgi:hypothetical protein